MKVSSVIAQVKLQSLYLSTVHSRSQFLLLVEGVMRAGKELGKQPQAEELV
jgi:hypothetical protein